MILRESGGTLVSFLSQCSGLARTKDRDYKKRTPGTYVADGVAWSWLFWRCPCTFSTTTVESRGYPWRVTQLGDGVRTLLALSNCAYLRCREPIRRNSSSRPLGQPSIDWCCGKRKCLAVQKRTRPAQAPENSISGLRSMRRRSGRGVCVGDKMMHSCGYSMFRSELTAAARKGHLQIDGGSESPQGWERRVMTARQEEPVDYRVGGLVGLADS